MPSHEDVLGLEDLILLFIGPDIDKDPPAKFQYAVHLIDGGYSKGLRREMMDDCNGDDAIEQVGADREF